MANLKGSVIDNLGSPLKGVQVKTGIWTARTNKLGWYALRLIPTGKRSVDFSKNGYGRLTMSITINPGVNTLDVTMTLITGTLSGKVRDQAAQLLAGVAVTLSGVTPTSTDSSGNYSFAGIIPGNYSISFVKAGYTPVNM